MSELFKDVPAKLIEKPAALMIVLSILLIVLGATGGVTGWFQADSNGRIVLIVVGLIFFGISLFFFIKRPELNQKSDLSIGRTIKTSIKNTHPDPGPTVGTVQLKGNISGSIPQGHEIHAVKIFDQGLVPLGKATLDLPQEDTWRTGILDIGGSPGEERVLGIFLVGPAGIALFNYFRKAAEVHNPLVSALAKVGQDARYLPPIPEPIPETIKCDSIRLRRA